MTTARPHVTVEKLLLNMTNQFVLVRNQLPTNLHLQLSQAFAWWATHHSNTHWINSGHRPTVDPSVAWWMQHLSKVTIEQIPSSNLVNYELALRQLSEWLLKGTAK